MAVSGCVGFCGYLRWGFCVSCDLMSGGMGWGLDEQQDDEIRCYVWGLGCCRHVAAAAAAAGSQGMAWQGRAGQYCWC